MSKFGCHEKFVGQAARLKSRNVETVAASQGLRILVRLRRLAPLAMRTGLRPDDRSHAPEGLGG